MLWDGCTARVGGPPTAPKGMGAKTGATGGEASAVAKTGATGGEASAVAAAAEVWAAGAPPIPWSPCSIPLLPLELPWESCRVLRLSVVLHIEQPAKGIWVIGVHA